MKTTPYLSIIIPTYNEEYRLGITLDTIVHFLQQKHYSFEILIIDDGSTDKTMEVATKKAATYKDCHIRFVKQTKNHGKGYVIKEGMLAAQGDCILFTDADLSTPITELDIMLPHLETQWDIVIGSRALNRKLVKKKQPWYRDFIGRLFNIAVQTLYLPGIKDSQCGFKLFKRDAAKAIFSKLRIQSFIFDVEALWLGKKTWLQDERNTSEMGEFRRYSFQTFYQQFYPDVERSFADQVTAQK